VTTRRKKPSPSLLEGKKATVFMERNGLTIRVDDVDADKAGLVAADLLMAFRLLRTNFPELIDILPPVEGGYPIDVRDDEWAEEGHRAGFKA
jgi:hypothetical protein